MLDLITNNITYTGAKNYTPYINLGITLTNLIIAIFLNFFLFKKRKKEERDYQKNAKLFQSLIIDKLESFLEYFSNAHVVVYELINSSNGFNQHIRVQKLQQCCDQLEKILREVEIKLTPYIQCYSNSMKVEMYQCCEELFDKFIEIASGLPSEDFDSQSSTMDLAQQKDAYTTKFFTIVKRFSP